MESNNFSLIQLQNWMQGMLVHHVPLVDSNVETAAAGVEDVVHASQRLSAVRHLDIYRYSYIARLRSCMQSQFSALAHALGNELFEMFADQYLDVYPSDSYTLNTLGEKFATFLSETRPDADLEEKESWPDFMIELATFEYTLSLIFDEHTTDNNTATPAVDAPDALLKTAPVFYLFHHQFPICDYYLQFSQGKEPELPFPEESYCAVTRHHYKLGLFSIRGAQYYFLKSMQQGNAIEEAKNDLVKTFGFDRNKLNQIWPEWKKNFIQSGFFVTIND
jgi:hypothetical protein